MNFKKKADSTEQLLELLRMKEEPTPVAAPQDNDPGDEVRFAVLELLNEEHIPLAPETHVSPKKDVSTSPTGTTGPLTIDEPSRRGIRPAPSKTATDPAPAKSGFGKARSETSPVVSSSEESLYDLGDLDIELNIGGAEDASELEATTHEVTQTQGRQDESSAAPKAPSVNDLSDGELDFSLKGEASSASESALDVSSASKPSANGFSSNESSIEDALIDVFGKPNPAPAAGNPQKTPTKTVFSVDGDKDAFVATSENSTSIEKPTSVHAAEPSRKNGQPGPSEKLGADEKSGPDKPSRAISSEPSEPSEQSELGALGDLPQKPSKRKAPRKPLFSIDLGVGRGVKSVLGVDVNSDRVRIVRMSKRDIRNRLESMGEYAFPDDMKIGSDEFTAFLGEAISNHTDGKDCEIWSSLRIVELDIAPILIPKVPQKKIAETVYWKLQKEKKFDAAEYELDFRVQEYVKDGGINRINVLTCLAKRDGIDRLRDWFNRCGYSLFGVTALPTAFRQVYLNGYAEYDGDLCANLHIDTNFSSITIVENGQIRFCRTIKSGTYGMAESLMEAFNRRKASGVDLEFASSLDKRVPQKDDKLTLRRSKQLIYHKLLGYEVPSDMPGQDLTVEEILDITYSAMDRLARQAERTLEYYYTNFNQRCDSLHLSGEIFACESVYDYFANQLRLPLTLFDPLLSDKLGSTTALEMPDGKRLGTNLAVALSMVDAKNSINLHSNYEKRNKEAQSRLMDNVLALGAVCLVAVAAVFYLVMSQVADTSADRLKVLQNRLNQFEPRITESQLTMMTARVGADRKNYKRLGEKFESLALLAELQALTPENIRLLRVEMDFGKPATEQAATTGKGKKTSSQPPTKLMIVEGIVLSGTEGYDTSLSRYIIGLEGSRLFSLPNILSSSIAEFVPEGEVMRFTLHVEVD